MSSVALGGRRSCRPGGALIGLIDRHAVNHKGGFLIKALKQLLCADMRRLRNQTADIVEAVPFETTPMRPIKKHLVQYAALRDAHTNN